MGRELALRAVTRFLDLLFPRRCVGCKAEGSWLCSLCQQDVLASAKLTEISEQTWALYPFEQPLVRELLHTLKYNGVDEVAEVLVVLTQRSAIRPRLQSYFGSAVLVPVPTSQPTLKRRGYNQAEVLAQAIGRWLNVPVRPELLQKTKQGTSVGKTAAERQQAAAQKFRWSGKTESRTIVLVDDICTTGSTLAACRAALPAGVTAKALVVAYKSLAI